MVDITRVATPVVRKPTKSTKPPNWFLHKPNSSLHSYRQKKASISHHQLKINHHHSPFSLDIKRLLYLNSGLSLICTPINTTKFATMHIPHLCTQERKLIMALRVMSVREKRQVGQGHISTNSNYEQTGVWCGK